MHRIIVGFTLASAAIVANATAPYSVTATILDAMTAETLPGATCSVFATTDTIKPLVSGMADANGVITLNLPGFGSYMLRASMAGQKTATRRFTLTAEEPVATLGSIVLQSEGSELEEVEVVRRRPVIETTGDKVTYNLNEDPSTQTHTVIEMLRKVPMVTVDAQDNIMVNGQSNFKIYINGKEDQMLTQNASTVLKSMPANAIKRIEVILDPGAKYDAEGVGGILNIITETQTSTDGELATISVGSGAQATVASLYGILKKNKITASADVSYRYLYPDRTSDGGIYRETLGVGHPTITDQKIWQKNNNQFVNGNARLSWEPNENNLFTISASGYGMSGTQKNTVKSTTTTQGMSTQFSHQRLRTKYMWSSLTVNAGYQHNFDKKGQNIVFSYQYVRGWNNRKHYLSMIENSIPDFTPCIYDYTNSPTNEHTFQLDYTKPFSQYFTLEAGAKGILRRNSSDGYQMNGSSWEELILSDYNDVKMKQNQDVAAAYATYAGTFGKFGLKAGLRYEYTRLSVTFQSKGYDDFASDLNDLVPNASLSFSITPTQNIYASYQQRIRRPSVRELNPHRSEIITGLVDMGNPELTSAKKHTLALSYSNFSGKLGINFRTFYSFSNNQISQYIYQEKGTMIQSYANVGNEKTWGLNGFVKYQINALMDFSVNASVQYDYYCYRAQNMKNHGWTMDLHANYNYSMPWQIKFNAYGGFSTRQYDLQGEMSGWRYYGVSFSRSFLKEDRLKITLSGNNFASSSQTYTNVTYGANFINKMTMRIKNWDVNLTVSVTLGNLKSNVKQTSKKIQNDDVQQQSGGG